MFGSWGNILSSSDANGQSGDRASLKRKRDNNEVATFKPVNDALTPNSYYQIKVCDGTSLITSVSFPYEPYDIQKIFVEKLVLALDSGGNALLESPTGTGKTACLICGALSWQKQYRENVKRSETHLIANSDLMKQKQLNGAALTENTKGSQNYPRILYSSRTHSQLSQAIRELKKIRYPESKAVVIGSRDQLCIHPEVKQENNATIKTHLCRQKVKNRSCNFYNNFEKLKESGRSLYSPSQSEEGCGEVMDIEDLVQSGIKQSVCPYFYSREMSSNKANIVFMPYNYVIDATSRKAHNIELANNVVIFDEGHNIDSLCEESASFSLTSIEVASAFKETQKLLEKMAESDKKFQGVEGESKENALDASDIVLGDEVLTPDFNIGEVAALASIFHSLETTFLNVNVKTTGDEKGTVFRGSVIYSWLEDAGLKPDITHGVIGTLDKISSYLSTVQSSNAFNVRPYGIMKMCDVLKQLYPDQGQDLYANYFMRNCSRTEFKMYVSLLEEKERATNDPWAKKNSSAALSTDVKPRVVNYWCFSPAYALKSVIQQHVRSVVITSGTLSPLSSFELEMRITFPWQLQNPHIVGPSQFFAAVVKSGPLGANLSSAFTNRNNKAYLDDLGALIANMCKVVPHGMLVFFPSYSVMSNCIDKWKQGDAWDRITQHKPVHVEPRDKGALVEVIAQFNLDVKTRDNNRGAAFFAVCRGKVSEGLDFADINGRAVIITGLPYPPQFDPRVKLKMDYLDGVKSKLEQPKKGNASELLDGRTWYQQQAIRAVNQAVGRVLRHKNDYGAILLCDERFSYPANRAQLSNWIRPSLREYKSYQTLPKDLISFYRIAQMKYPYKDQNGSSKDSDISVVAASTSNSMSSHLKRSAISGQPKIRIARPDLKKSNQVTHHVPKPNWMNNSYFSVDSDDCSKPQRGSQESVLTQLMSFDDDFHVSQSPTPVDSSSQVGSSQMGRTSLSMTKKIKLVRTNRALIKEEEKLERSAEKNECNVQSSAKDSQKGSSDHSVGSSNSKELFDLLRKQLGSEDFKCWKKVLLDYLKSTSSDVETKFNILCTFVHAKLAGSGFTRARDLLKKYIKNGHQKQYFELCSRIKRE